MCVPCATIRAETYETTSPEKGQKGRCSMKWMLTVLLAGALILGGCGETTSKERLNLLAQGLGVAKTESQQADADIATLSEVVASMQADLDNPDLSPKDAEKLGKALRETQEALSTVMHHKLAIDQAIADAEVKVADIAARQDPGIADEIEAIAESVKVGSSVLPPPWNVYAGWAGIGLAGLAEFFRRRWKATTTNVVHAVDRAKTTLTPEAKVAFSAELGKAELDSTRLAVAKLRK